ncbi:hypothetical protein [Gymnodinialimonas hymeniacidonis]|uniref:hypothetical protein n=1 Tax=Gymnodinialimonas hymeniacidonis TaxID=3126508 RepID=UPI0034C6B929
MKLPSEIIHDLKPLMPGHGENKVSVASDGRKATVVVSFDAEGGGQRTATLTFDRVCFVSTSSFPGPASIAPGTYEADFVSGAVIKAENSDLSASWVAHWAKSGLTRDCNHYVMFWTSENKVVHIVAASVQLS